MTDGRPDAPAETTTKLTPAILKGGEARARKVLYMLLHIRESTGSGEILYQNKQKSHFSGKNQPTPSRKEP